MLKYSRGELVDEHTVSGRRANGLYRVIGNDVTVVHAGAGAGQDFSPFSM